MDDLRFSIVDVAEEAGFAINDLRTTTRAETGDRFVSIMQGCNMHCTFCIVPQTRGAERSRSIEEIVREVRDLVSRGVKEVTLARTNRKSLRPARISRKMAIKLHSCNCSKRCTRSTGSNGSASLPLIRSDFGEDLIDAFGRLPKLAEHVHLPLQSGSNKILKAMHRDLHRGKICRSCPIASGDARDGIAITTDVIVGFPGETDNDYEQTRDLVETNPI